MKPKRITKKQAREFLELTRETAIGLGFIEFPPDPDYPVYNMHGNKMWAMTDAGMYVVTVHEVTAFWIDFHAGHQTLWVNGRFTLTNHPNLPRGTGYTGKWNFYGYDPEQAVRQFTDSMERVGCRKPTDKERERFEAKEKERMEKISENRRKEVDLTPA